MNDCNQPSLLGTGNSNDVPSADNGWEHIPDYKPYIDRAHQLRKEEMDRCFSWLWRWISSPFSWLFRTSSTHTTPDALALYGLDEPQPERTSEGK